MMNAFALLVPLMLATPGPHAVEGADLVVWAPKLEALAHLHGFLGPASERSVLMQPRSYAPDFHPLFTVDPFQPEALTPLGIDPAGPATLSRRGRGQFICTGVQDAARFEKAAKEKLEAAGNLGATKVQGVTVHTSSLEGHPIAAYVLRGGEACAWAGGTLSPAQMAEFAKLPGHVSAEAQKALQGVTGVVRVRTRGLAVGFDGRGSALIAEGHTTEQRMSLALVPAAPTPFAGLVPSGLFFARMRVTPSSLAAFIKVQVQSGCEACDDAAMAQQLEGMAQVLTGEAVVRIDHLEPGASLSRAAARLNALRFGMVVEAQDAAKARQYVDALARTSPAHSTGDGALVPLDAGELRVEAHGRLISIGNDPLALQALAPVLVAKAVAVSHSLEARADPALAARALRQISLMDVIGSRELAGLFAFGTEFGPLLGTSEVLEAWAQPQGNGTQFHLRWALKPGVTP